MSLQTPTKKKEDDSIHQKFNEAFENMQNFQNMISKYSTSRGRTNLTQEEYIKSFKRDLSADESDPNHYDEKITHKEKKPKIESDPEQIQFGDGWVYSGKTLDKKFHGFGHLMQNEEVVYGGEFRDGLFHGKGTLFFHPNFSQLIKSQTAWEKYQGQFKDGDATGFGNLYEIGGLIKTGYWSKGSSFFIVETQSLTSY